MGVKEGGVGRRTALLPVHCLKQFSGFPPRTDCGELAGPLKVQFTSKQHLGSGLLSFLAGPDSHCVNPPPTLSLDTPRLSLALGQPAWLPRGRLHSGWKEARMQRGSFACNPALHPFLPEPSTEALFPRSEGTRRGDHGFPGLSRGNEQRKWAQASWCQS